jgi:hypothetical protein
MNMLVSTTIAGTAVSSGRLAKASNDPIFQLIEQHKVATDALEAACTHLSEMEQAISKRLRQGRSICFEVKTVETDDPRWTAANIRWTDCSARQDDIAIEMLNVKPTTLAGLQAMLTYAVQHVAEGHIWPDGEQIKDDDDRDQGEAVLGLHNRDWNFYLMRNLGEAIQSIAA